MVMQTIFSTNRCQYKLIKIKYVMTGLKETLEKNILKIPTNSLHNLSFWVGHNLSWKR